MNKLIAALLLTAPLAACSTTSFAPPGVNPQLKANIAGSAGCTGAAHGPAISRTVEGAMTLTDNYIFSYRCAQRELANGRQFFQVPSFLAAVGGLIGPTLGMSNDAVLLTGAGAGVVNTGHSYYAPRSKAGTVGSALRALTCIKTEAVGISYFKTQKPDEQQMRQMLDVLKAQEQRLTEQLDQDPENRTKLVVNMEQQDDLTALLAERMIAGAAATDGVTIDAEVQYFEMVAGALFSVESILAERLSDAGSFDTTEIFAKLKELAKAHSDAEQALADAKPKDKTGKPLARNLWSAETKHDVVNLENAALQPKLQTCVLQAWA